MSQDTDKVFDALLKRHLGGSLEASGTSMECPDENRVSAYLEGTLGSDLRLSFEKHASLCARCQDELSLLLKSKGVTASTTLALSPARDFNRHWLAIFQSGLARLTNLGLKPALAILVVTVISGYVGYELLQRRAPHKALTPEVAQSMPERDRSADEVGSLQEADGREAGARLAIETDKSRGSRENEVALKAAKKANEIKSGVASQPSLVLNDTAQAKDQKAPFPPEPYSISQTGRASAGGSKSETLEGQRRLSETPSAPLPVAAPSSGAEGKVGAVTSHRTSLNGPVPSSAKPADEEAQPEVAFKAKESSLRKTKVDALLVAGQASAKQTNREDSLRKEAQTPENAQKDTNHRRIRAADKTFELRNNVWIDLSIGDQAEKMVEVIIDKNSSDYEEQIKPLSAYQPVLSLDEECFIEHEGKIYHVRSSP